MFGIRLTRKNPTTLVIEVDLSVHKGSARPSSSGKSIVVASSEGNLDVPGAGDFRLGLNVYTKTQQEGK